MFSIKLYESVNSRYLYHTLLTAVYRVANGTKWMANFLGMKEMLINKSCRWCAPIAKFCCQNDMIFSTHNDLFCLSGIKTSCIFWILSPRFILYGCLPNSAMTPMLWDKGNDNLVLLKVFRTSYILIKINTTIYHFIHVVKK